MTSLAPQDRYRRIDLLGRGGMGEVFLADDVVLRRKVAIKVVHKTALANPRAEKLLRREAKAAAALDNPFICKVYEVGESNGRVFIAMEYIQGETLRQRMQRGPIPMREVIGIAREIADGLEEAGRQRVIHRDLKPSNIIITAQGHVKIMDFGLAKRLPGEDSMDESTGTPDGMVVGTREYMSPEQLRGKPLEPNSDLFALGLILYEILSGEHPFKKGSPLDTQFAILNENTADLAELCPQAPDALCDIVERLLHKAASDRPKIAELRERLAGISDSGRLDALANAHGDMKRPPRERTMGTSASMEAYVARRPRVALGVGLALFAIIVGLSLWVALRPDPEMPQARMSTLVTWPSNEDHASLSPDGKSVTFISNRNGVKDIWFMDIAGGEPRRLTHQPGDLTAQVFSEDGTEIAYTLESPTQKLFQTIRLDGGPPTRSFSLPNDMRILRLICWVGGDVFMESSNRLLLKLSLANGQVVQVPTLSRATQQSADYDVSRDGHRIVLDAVNDDGSRSIWIQDMGGEARAVTQPGATDRSPFFSDAAGNGRLFLESNRSGQEDLWFIDKVGHEPRQITFGSNREFIEAVSRDGRVIVFSEQEVGGFIFSYEVDKKVRHQLTAENMRDITPSMAAGGRVAFARTQLVGDSPVSFSSIVIGTAVDGRLDDAKVVVRDGFAPLLSPDGRYLAFLTRASEKARPHMNLLEIETGHVRDLGERLLRTLAYIDFAWCFSRRDFQWSSQGLLYYTDTLDGVSSRLVKLLPGTDPEVVTTFEKDEMVGDLTIDPSGSTATFVLNTRGKDAALLQVAQGKVSSLFTAKEGSVSLLGLFKGLPLVAVSSRTRPQLGALYSLEIGTLAEGELHKLVETQAVFKSWQFIPAANAVAFSRRDSADVENVFLKDLQTGAETPVTSNGIQGIAFSPVSASGRLLVYSQQLRNRDVGIIRLDSR
ncbi:MAG: protein kinase [Vicinamibacteria bacterium]